MPYRVDSFHIPVNEGDCAIHLLVETGPGKGGGETVSLDRGTRGEVKNAVLVDGGVKENTGETRRRTIEWINQHYCVGPKQLQLDSIVITHWDQDHYSGVKQILEDSFTEEEKKKSETLMLKWNGETPATHFYCPLRKDTKKIPGGEKAARGLRKKFTVKDFKEDGGENIISIICIKIGKKDKMFAQFHSADEDLWKVLGWDFFHNAPTKSNEQQSLPDLVNKKNRPPQDQPGLFCVGVVGTNLANPTPLKSLILDDDDVTKSNKSSIASIIAWPGSPPRVSHYFAGDLSQSYERLIQSWIQGAGKEQVEKIEKITSVKINHHGAQSSTTLDLFDEFKPLNTFISNPSSGKHGHPSM